MHISELGLDLIKHFEGFRARRYLCPAGKHTIGYGHVISKAEWPDMADATLTEHQAAAILVMDMDRFERQIREAVTVPVKQHQFDALASIVMNVGPGDVGRRSGIIRLKDGGPSTLLRKLNDGDEDGCAEEFLRWKFANGLALPGLARRRAAEKRLFKFGAWRQAEVD